MRSKYIASLFVTLFLTTTDIFSQGIYKTASDFEKGILSYEWQPLNADVAFNPAIVRVNNAGEVVKLYKDDVFGYRDKKGRDFRFYNNHNYRIIDQGPIFLYSRTENVVDGKAKMRKSRYFFSVQKDSQLTDLTRTNLKRAFPSNRKLHELIDLHFKTDEELVKFDSFNREYTLKYLVSKTDQ